jgi:hypothetical protein
VFYGLFYILCLVPKAADLQLLEEGSIHVLSNLLNSGSRRDALQDLLPVEGTDAALFKSLS